METARPYKLEHAGVWRTAKKDVSVYRAFARCPGDDCTGEVMTVVPTGLTVHAQCECGEEFHISTWWESGEIGRVTQIPGTGKSGVKACFPCSHPDGETCGGCEGSEGERGGA